MDRKLSVAVVGLGAMGAGIARRLDAAGLLIAARDIDPSAFARTGLSAPVQDADPAALSAADIVLCAVPGSAEIEILIEDGLLSGPGGRQVLVDLTTSHPRDTKILAERARAAGRGYLDCGMTGGASGADKGTLTLMVGGEADDLAFCRPALDRIARQVFHVGPSTAGHTMKLVHNLVCHGVFMLTAEACRLAEECGIEAETAIAVMNAGNARSFITERRFPDHILSGRFDGRSRVQNLAKDLRMAAELAEGQDVPALYADLTAALLAQALRDGRGEDDFTTLYKAIGELERALPAG